MSPPERLITCPFPHFRMHAHVLAICTPATASEHSGGQDAEQKIITLISQESLKECLTGMHVCFRALK